MAQFTRWQDRQPGRGGSGRSEQLDALRQMTHQYVIESLGPTEDADLSDAELRRVVHEALNRAVADDNVVLSANEKAQLVQDVSDDAVGYGPITSLLKDTTVTEVMVNGPKNVFVERAGRLEAADVEFIDREHLRRVIDKIVTAVGRRIDESTPLVDARLPDGSRVNAIIHPLAIDGPYLTIRKFAADPYTVTDLIEFGTMSAPVAHFIDACVRGRMNIVVSGGTGTGKTTLLNVISSFIPDDERIVTIEDAKELQMQQPHVCTLEARPPNIEGAGMVSVRDLVRNSLRMRPDRIIVGEARGGEALDMLQAMNTGHDGSLTTIHSNTPRDTLSRVETMTLMAGEGLPARAIREQMASALDVIVHLQRLHDGTRRVSHVSEVQGMEGDVIVLQDLYLFDFGMSVDEDGRFLGHLKSTGIRPHFAERLEDHGIELEPELFQLEPFAAASGGDAMIFLVTLLVAGAIAAMVFALATVFSTSQSKVERQLAGYEAAEEPNRPQASAGTVLTVESGTIRGAMRLSEHVAESTGVLGRADKLLAQANVAMRPAELVFWVPLLAAFVLLLGFIVGGLIIGLVLAALAIVIPIGVLSNKRRKRLQAFDAQLPETLNLLAGAMRAGFSFLQALDAVVHETSDPIQSEFRKVLNESRLGRPPEASMGEVADRMESQDLAWTVMAIEIQREVGGNLAELLDTIADTMIQRERLRREIRSLTAEGRFSGIVLSLVPPLMALLIWTIQPDFIEALFDQTIGVLAIIGAVVLTIIGWLWIRAIVDIEV